MVPSDGFGVYVHIPFCIRRCDYCAFATWDDRPQLIGEYVDAVAAELVRLHDDRRATSVFFGGGTPSLLTPGQLSQLLTRMDLATDAEVTVECNPDTVDAGALRGYRDAGVTRISLGVQSMVPHVLASLGRSHDPENVVAAVDAIDAAGFTTWNLDIIYGAVGESFDDWCRTLDSAMALAPPHVSAYGLTVEAGTPLAAQPERYPDDDDQADKYLETDARFASVGLVNYEVSNWATPGHECRHNLLYWEQGDYRGVGCAAHSHLDGRRWWNLRTPERYIDAVRRGVSVEAAGELLDRDERSLERVQLSLRTTHGVTVDEIDLDGIEHLVDVDDDRVTLNVQGRLLANEVAMRLRPSTGA
jgi:putative oxygen-independent coproporphyrinogen III oxidase